MKRALSFLILFVACLSLSACGGGKELVDMQTLEENGYMAIVWEDRIYIPFCVVSKNDRGAQIGCVNGDKDDRVSEYKEYSPAEWIVNDLTMDGGAILYKEKSVTDIPDGLQSEYEWNNEKQQEK